MKKTAFLLFLGLFFGAFSAFACTNFIVTKGASATGSAYLVYTNDGEYLPHLTYSPAMDHAPGTTLTLRSYRSSIQGDVLQPPHTFAKIGFHINEFQVAIGETTFTGREELWNHKKHLQYWHLMALALDRAQTARQAVEAMAELVEEYGYGSEGESFSIVDPDEAWIMEMVGTGNGGEGAVWVAVKIPDGMVAAHANMARIGEFPLDDPENCLYSENVISFAIEKGYYDPESGKPFRFNEVYNPPTPERLRYCESRVWSLFRKAAPSQNFSPDYHRGVKGAERYPLWIKPDKKLKLSDVFNFIRDHYEGTPYDMTKGLQAGPFGTPNRCRPLYWHVDSTKYAWERPISTYNTAFSFVAELRSNLPDAVGGILWYGVDDTYFTCYMPLYAGITAVPENFAKGDFNEFSWESAWWVFNFVSNFANIRYSYMIKDIRKVQHQLESRFIAERDSITRQAAALWKENPDKAREFLTEYCTKNGKMVVQRWKKLGEHLICKYNDGYIKNQQGRARPEGYPQHWLEKVVEDEPEQFKIPEAEDKNQVKSF